VFELALTCFPFAALTSSVPVITSASVFISIVHLLAVVEKSSLKRVKLVPLYINWKTLEALIAPLCGSLPSLVLMANAQGQKSALQAPVFAVVTLQLNT
jgi:hypothetical protein